MASRSTIHDQQYRPVSNVETAANDSMSVRAVRDMAMGINNAVGRVCAPRISDAWPSSSLAVGAWKDSTNGTTEQVLVPSWPSLTCGPQGHYTHACWSVVAYLGAGSNNCVLTAYCSEKRYRGPSTLTAASKATLGRYSYRETTISTVIGGGDVAVVSSGDSGLLLCPNPSGEVYFTISSAFSAASANNKIVVMHSAITPTRVLLDWAT